MTVDARSVGVLLGTGGVDAVPAFGGGATVLAVVDSGTTGVDVRGGGPVVNVAAHGVNLTVGATDIALPAVVVTYVVKPVGVRGVGATISVAAPVRVAMATGPGVAGFLVVLIRPVRLLFMVAARVVVFAVFLHVVVVVFVPVVVVVFVPVVVAVPVVVVAPAPITLPVVILMPALPHVPER